jgi:hypothetical protein
MQMHESDHPDTAAAEWLLSAAAVRERAEMLFRAGLRGELAHFTIDLDRLGPAADQVVATIRAQYPTLEIPYHSRWRHFEAGGLDRWASLDAAMPWPDLAARARAAFDLAIVSVLLDAGAGPAWSYEEGRTGETYARSEGLAVASFDLFIGGAFSDQPDDPFRVDGTALETFSVLELARGMQVTPANPLVGLEGRASLLNRLGTAVETAPEIFGLADSPRPGGLFDYLAAKATDGRLPAPGILEAILVHLGPVWPGRIELAEIELGDTWRHPAAATDDATSELVPFHKLSQWLAYSLIEPLEAAGIAVTELDGLTGLPEYRNGGLFLDMGVLRLKDEHDRERAHAVESPLVVEWRALTVALLDRIAVEIRTRLDLTAGAFPLAKVLEGGTWATGRRLAGERRSGGEPPIQIVSDGTVF